MQDNKTAFTNKVELPQGVFWYTDPDALSSDVQLRLTCAKLATDSNSSYPVQLAEQIYQFVTQDDKPEADTADSQPPMPALGNDNVAGATPLEDHKLLCTTSDEASLVKSQIEDLAQELNRAMKTAHEMGLKTNVLVKGPNVTAVGDPGYLIRVQVYDTVPY